MNGSPIFHFPCPGCVSRASPLGVLLSPLGCLRGLALRVLHGPGFRRALGAGRQFLQPRNPPDRTVCQLHATALHLLGLDHERLTWCLNGLEQRLTGFEGKGVILDLLA